MTSEERKPERDVVAYLKDRDKPCPSCGYNLRGVGKPVCPECGWELAFSKKSSLSAARSQGFWQIGFAGGLISAGLLTWFLLFAVADAPDQEPLAWALLATQIVGLIAWWRGARWLRARRRWARWLSVLIISWPFALVGVYLGLLLTALLAALLFP